MFIDCKSESQEGNSFSLKKNDDKDKFLSSVLIYHTRHKVKAVLKLGPLNTLSQFYNREIAVAFISIMF